MISLRKTPSCSQRPCFDNNDLRNRDPVNNPEHYTSGDIECIDAIRASMTPEAFKGFLKGNVIKYLWRYQMKGKPIEDLQKAEWYLSRLEEEERNDSCGNASK